jgi:hypothetical protein
VGGSFYKQVTHYVGYRILADDEFKGANDDRRHEIAANKPTNAENVPANAKKQSNPRTHTATTTKRLTFLPERAATLGLYSDALRSKMAS